MNQKEAIIDRLLQEFELTPVLIDIGSSGAGQQIFSALAKRSIIVGFDPDARGQDSNFASGFKESLLVPKAVTHDPEADEVPFTLTKYSSCSSTLRANPTTTGAFIFREAFEPIRTVTVPAITLNKVAEQYGFHSFDWIKVDSQGTDLRILQSLGPDLLNQVMAADVEPGLLDFYVGEDTFTLTHEFLTRNGFWMSDLKHQAYAYMTEETAGWLEEKNNLKISFNELEGSPICIEGRYMRTIAHLKKCPVRSVHLEFVFALVDKKIGFAFEILREFEDLFGGQSRVRSYIDCACALLVVEKSRPSSSVMEKAISRIRKIRFKNEQE